MGLLLDCKEIQPVHSERDQPWDFFGRNDAKAETPVLSPPHAKSWLIGKDSDAGRDWGQEKKGMTEDEMAGWHHWLDGRESEWTPGVGDGQGGLACSNSWGRKELDMTERLNWTELMNICVQIFVWTLFSVLLSISLRVELPDHWVILCSNFWETIKLSFRVAVPFYIPSSHVGGSPFLHILANTCFPSFWSLVILVGVKQYLIVTP